ncbi:hypothetical protein O1611_g10071 [Lasiodiplodia mahajangana]|uniref:Uncharacterized protein n=1 Tax=Lasiodiplodia mahajangana TaxID=1108764 RepID=A0ACC2J2C3_9PEZI|nr:hypothetical protein O1611_g10071 [Lasiodiplodia mahajangana]
MGTRMSTLTEDNWSGFVGIIHGRRTTALLALILILVSLMTYSLNETVEFNTLPHHGAPNNINTPKGGIAESHQPKDTLSPNNSPIPEPGATNILSASPEAPLRTEAPMNMSVPVSISSPAPLGGGIPLRIMFLGASSTHELGFQSALHDRLAALGNPIDVIESQPHGTPIEKEVEAYAGGRIDQIHEQATHAITSTKPNIFVLYTSIDDCMQKRNTDNVGEP